MCHRCFLSPLWTMHWYTIIILGKERKMQKIICNKLYDTTTATVVKKVTNGEWGDPAGYEETLYVTPEGYYFLYTFGGEDPHTLPRRSSVCRRRLQTPLLRITENKPTKKR